METLTAYVREKAPLPYPDKEAVNKLKKDVQETGWLLPADVQAALTAVGRRRVEQDVSELTLQLEGTNLTRANLENAHLERANFTGTFLTGALLAGTHLENAVLSDAQLEGAILHNAHLLGSSLDHADLKGAFLRGADLSGADLSRANLSGANLSSANLRRANLSRAYLDGADLSGANLSGAALSDVRVSAFGALPLNFSNLSTEDQGEYMRQAKAYLLQEQLNKACGDAETKLPEGLTIPFCDDQGQSAPTVTGNDPSGYA